MSEAASYFVACHACQAEFDALQAGWCSCVATDPSVTCPNCSSCLCKATAAYQRRFWAAAPRALRERRVGAVPAPSALPPNPPPEDVRRPLVLLVDDERAIQMVALRVIAALGYGMLHASNGVEGLDLAKRYKPDLVLTDALMPRMDGRDMAREIKGDPDTSHIKVVVMTGLYTNVKYRNEAFLDYKVDGYVSKPIDVPQLVQVLEQHLNPGPPPADA